MRTLIMVVLLAACASTTQSPGGEKPSYLPEVTAEVPNFDAITRRFYTPGLDDGYVPQGLTVAGTDVLVAAYRSAEPKVNTGPCRVFRIEQATGRTTGFFDVTPGACTHGGGLAWLGGGMVMLADTFRLFRVDLARAIATGRAEDGMRGSVKLAGALRGSFAAFDGRDPWIGTWTKEAAQARMFRLPATLFDTHDGQTVTEAVALASIPIPVEVQGAAFDAKGGLWATASASRWGKLYRLDRQGKPEAEYAMVPGIEDIEFDADGGLWAVSESGTRKYLAWATKWPFVFRLDVGRLR